MEGLGGSPKTNNCTGYLWRTTLLPAIGTYISAGVRYFLPASKNTSTSKVFRGKLPLAYKENCTPARTGLALAGSSMVRQW